MYQSPWEIQILSKSCLCQAVSPCIYIEEATIWKYHKGEYLLYQNIHIQFVHWTRIYWPSHRWHPKKIAPLIKYDSTWFEIINSLSSFGLPIIQVIHYKLYTYFIISLHNKWWVLIHFSFWRLVGNILMLIPCIAIFPHDHWIAAICQFNINS